MRDRVYLSKRFIFGASVIAITVIVALFAQKLAPHDPFQQSLIFGLEPPTHGHPMGRDLLGRDILSRLIFGARVSVGIGLTVITISLIIGTVTGCVAGISGGWMDLIFMRIVEVAQAFPGILLAIAIMAVLGPGFGNLVLALCLTGWTGFARLMRGQTLLLRESEFVLASVASGAGIFRLIFFHILPNCAGLLLVESAFGIASVILSEAGLSFLGLGVQPPAPSWGSMMNEGREFLLVAPHLTVFPGLCLFLLVLAVNLVADKLRDALSIR
jgi:peptide/nickel transport system permease protein